MSVYKPKKGSTGHKALSHIYSAAVHAHAGNVIKAQEHHEKAASYAEAHTKELKAGGMHTEADQFKHETRKLLKKLNKLMGDSGKWYSKSEKKGDLEKSFGSGAPLPPPGSQVEPKNIDTKQQVKINQHPGYKPEYDYKAFHELTPQDRERALHAYGERDMESHLYAHDRATGEWQYGQRWKAPKEMLAARKPQANEHFPAIDPVKPQLLPQHKSGAGVRIHAEGHELHGKLGVVQHPNPNMPGKVVVRVQNKGRFENHFMEPDQVKLSKLASVAKSETREAASTIVTLEKSKKVIARLRKNEE